MTHAMIGSRNSSGTSSVSSPALLPDGRDSARSAILLLSCCRSDSVSRRATSSGKVSCHGSVSSKRRLSGSQLTFSSRRCDSSCWSGADCGSGPQSFPGLLFRSHDCILCVWPSSTCARQRPARVPTTGASMTGRLIFSAFGVVVKKSWNGLPSGPADAWLRMKRMISTARTMLRDEPRRNAAGTSKATNSTMRSRFTLSSNIIRHLRWCCCRFGTR
mmetsp:Transcript_18380/g.43955  ORF Transcript_18380/g.43955 Transcript_18380/m.43955 type:complete len:217 (-) Transcript_18380:1844-2494(-)